MSIETPQSLEVLVDTIPDELRAWNQFVAWEYQSRMGRYAKVPINPRTGREAKSNDRVTWGAFQVALARAQRDRLAGIGFVFSARDPYAGVDLDRCREPQTGQLAPWAEEIIASLNSYAEVSPSGTGVKIFRLSRPFDEAWTVRAYVLARSGSSPLAAACSYAATCCWTWSPCPASVRGAAIRCKMRWRSKSNWARP
jgi:hypothetical protein